MALARLLTSSAARHDPARDWPSTWGRAVHLPAAWALAAIVALAAALRFAWLGQHSLWFDEAFVVSVTRLGWADLLTFLARADAHPPLYYAVMKVWAGIAGRSEAALRAPSACLSTLSVPLTYALARRVLPERVSLVATFLVAVSPFDVMAGQEARMYPLLSALAVGSSLALALSVEGGSRARWAGYALLAALMAYTHYLGVVVLAAQGLWVTAFERRSLARWLAAIGAAALLYAPWFAALIAGASRVAHLTRGPTGVVPYLTPDALLALFGFGGSLFGTATYFGDGTAGAAQRVIVVLPFVGLLCCGVVSLVERRRALGLVALPLAVTIGIAAPLSVAKPLFYPRIFSFLVPFYCLLLAEGIVAAAERAGRHRDRALLGLLAIVLAYGVPALARYDLDPSARPYDWRTAAAWVKGEARSGDYFLYVGIAAEDSFTYYYRPPYPARTLNLRPDPHPTFTPETAQQLAARYRRVWLILSTPFGPANAAVQRQLRPALSSAFRVTAGRGFNQIWIYLLQPSSHPVR